jgi:hypothetical protein
MTFVNNQPIYTHDNSISDEEGSVVSNSGFDLNSVPSLVNFQTRNVNITVSDMTIRGSDTYLKLHFEDADTYLFDCFWNMDGDDTITAKLVQQGNSLHVENVFYACEYNVLIKTQTWKLYGENHTRNYVYVMGPPDDSHYGV